MKIIISEDQQKLLIFTLHSMIKNYGVGIASQAVGGIENLFKTLNINSPMDFLHLFDDLDVVQSEEEPDWTLFRYKPKENLMIYRRQTDYVYINYEKIWVFLKKNFKLSEYEIELLTEEWLSEVYNLRGVIPHLPWYSQAWEVV